MCMEVAESDSYRISFGCRNSCSSFGCNSVGLCPGGLLKGFFRCEQIRKINVLVADRCKVGGAQFGHRDNAAFQGFEENAGGGLYVEGRVMGFFKSRVEEFFIQFREGGPFEPASLS